MLMRSKKNSAKSSSCENGCKKGHAGRVELWGERRDDGTFALMVRDVGNYNKLRSYCGFESLTAEDLLAVSASIQALVSGQVRTTEATPEQIQALIDSVKPVETTTVETPVTAETIEQLQQD
jgi:hypothetical protein